MWGEIERLVAPFVEYLDVWQIIHAELEDIFLLGVREDLLDVLDPFWIGVLLLDFLHYDADVKDLLHIIGEQLEELVGVVGCELVLDVSVHSLDEWFEWFGNGLRFDLCLEVLKIGLVIAFENQENRLDDLALKVMQVLIGIEDILASILKVGRAAKRPLIQLARQLDDFVDEFNYLDGDIIEVIIEIRVQNLDDDSEFFGCVFDKINGVDVNNGVVVSLLTKEVLHFTVVILAE